MPRLKKGQVRRPPSGNKNPSPATRFTAGNTAAANHKDRVEKRISKQMISDFRALVALGRDDDAAELAAQMFIRIKETQEPFLLEWLGYNLYPIPNVPMEIRHL